MIVIGVLFAVRMGTCAAAGLAAMNGEWWWALALAEVSFGLDLLAPGVLDKRQDILELVPDDDMGRIFSHGGSYAGGLAIFMGMGLFPRIGWGAWITIMSVLAVALLDMLLLMPWTGRTMPIVTWPRFIMAFVTVCMSVCLWRALHDGHLFLFSTAMVVLVVQNLRLAKRQQEARMVT